MKDYKVLYAGEKFDVVEVNGQRGLKAKSMSIAVMPYTVDENGMLREMGFLKEYNPFRENDYAITMITGTVETEDEDLISTATRELEEEGGLTVPTSEKQRWIYLGNFYPSKDGDQIIPTFAVDVTGIARKEAEGDGSIKEDKSEFMMIPVTEAMTTDEALPLATFLRLFNYFYAKTVANVQP